MARVLRAAPTHYLPPEPSIADVDKFLSDIAEERRHCLNHSGRLALIMFRCDRLLDGRIVLADKLACSALEASL